MSEYKGIFEHFKVYSKDIPFRGSRFHIQRPYRSETIPSTQVSSRASKIDNKVHGASTLWETTKGFRFGPRDQKLDTQSLFQLDIDHIRASTDIATLQKYVENLTFADVTLEDIQQYSDPYFLKLFQIAQLMLEYLLSVQESLLQQCTHEEEHCERLLLQCTDLKESNDILKAQVSKLQNDIRYKKRTIATFEAMLLKERLSTDPKSDRTDQKRTARCDLCGKLFVSIKYLHLHQRRKHNESNHLQNLNLSEEPRLSSTSLRPGHCAVKENPDSQKLSLQLREFQEFFQSETDRKEREIKTMEKQQETITYEMKQYWAQMQEMMLQMQAKQSQTHQAMVSQKEQLRNELLTQQQDLLKAHCGSHKTASVGELQSDDEGDQRIHSASENRQLETVLQTLVEMQREKHDTMEKVMLDNRKLWKELMRDRKRMQKCNTTQVNDLAQMMTLETRRFGTLIEPGLNENDQISFAVKCDQSSIIREPEVTDYPSPITIPEAIDLFQASISREEIVHEVIRQEELVQQPHSWTLEISSSQINEQFRFSNIVNKPINIDVRPDSTAHTLQNEIAEAVTLVSRKHGNSQWSLHPANVHIFHVESKVKLSDESAVFHLNGSIRVEFAKVKDLMEENDAALRIQCTIRCFLAKKCLKYRKLFHSIRLVLLQYSKDQLDSNDNPSQLETYASNSAPTGTLKSVWMDRARDRIEKQLEAKISEIPFNDQPQRPPSDVGDRVQHITGKLDQSRVDGALRQLRASCTENGFNDAITLRFLYSLMSKEQFSNESKEKETMISKEETRFPVSSDQTKKSKIDEITQLADAYEDDVKTSLYEKQTEAQKRSYKEAKLFMDSGN